MEKVYESLIFSGFHRLFLQNSCTGHSLSLIMFRSGCLTYASILSSNPVPPILFRCIKCQIRPLQQLSGTITASGVPLAYANTAGNLPLFQNGRVLNGSTDFQSQLLCFLQ